MRTYEDFLSAAVYCRGRINPYMYVYALSVAILHRPDTKGLRLPSLAEIFPDKYVDGGVFARAREESNVLQDGMRTPIELPKDYTASDLEEEHRVAYFREDLGINLHHWHWHLVYPGEAAANVVNKDRRGELFYYMHQQIIARYNFERLSNRLGRVKRLVNLRESITEGYFPKLDSLVASRIWQPRHSGSFLKDINREVDQIIFDLQDLERWRDRIIEAIQVGRVVNGKGENVDLTEMGGIDVLGNIMESANISINRNLYGDLHNLGHMAIAFIHDPDFRHLETFGVMGDPATAMRDPVFYRWHAFVDEIFQMHKRTLPRYTTAQLDYPGVKITKVELDTPGRSMNEFETFWQQRDIDLSRGMDFAPRGGVFARVTHLQHNAFNFRITVENNTNKQVQGTVRIFLAPKFDERGVGMLFKDQRLLFIELDKFTVTLKSNPKINLVERSSTLSSVAIPFETTFRDLESRPAGVSQDLFNFCGCGWPQNMLIPKGAPEGFPCELFIMISNFDNDKVDQPSGGGCEDAVSYCGLRDRKYPDRRSMGFPFDRMPRTGVDTLQQFLTPNMSVIDTKIVFATRTEAPKAAQTPAPAPLPAQPPKQTPAPGARPQAGPPSKPPAPAGGRRRQ
ncbi:hypothetical protein J437_LFUL018537 [Ladona fulva]|uniref:Tyrosinase copper-binding domain-containing protein n=1 Tax=Ladona fulva TaxID=123851 RepID=A0A8K0KQK1_LADFU|nr:hypothetical protein J437_LFUL018537 [Ladona fulva]